MVGFALVAVLFMGRINGTRRWFGVGGFGSGALYHLARRGVRVLGIERLSRSTSRVASAGSRRCEIGACEKFGKGRGFSVHGQWR